MSDRAITSSFIGLFGAFHEAIKDKLEEIEIEKFKERTLQNSSVTYSSLQIEYPQPRGIGHTAQQKRDKLKRKNKSK